MNFAILSVLICDLEQSAGLTDFGIPFIVVGVNRLSLA